MAFGLPSGPPSQPTLTAQRVVTTGDNTQVNLAVSGLDSDTAALVFRKATDEPWQKLTFSGSTGQDTAEPGKVYTYVALAKMTSSTWPAITYSRPSTPVVIKERSVHLYGSASTWSAVYGPETVPGPPTGSVSVQQNVAPLPTIALSFAGPFDHLAFFPYPDLPFYPSIMSYSAEREEKTDVLHIGTEATFEGEMDLNYDGGPWGTFMGNWWSTATVSGTGMLHRFDTAEGGEYGIPYQASGYVVFPWVKLRPGTVTSKGLGFDSASSPPSVMIPVGGTVAVRVSTTPNDLTPYGASVSFATSENIAQPEWPDPLEFAFESIGAVGPATIHAKIGENTEATLRAAVKRERVITVQLVRVQGVDGKGKSYVVKNAAGGTETPIGNYPDAQQLEEYLNSIYLPQANVRFTVIDRPGVVPLMYVNKNGLLLITLSGYHRGVFSDWDRDHRPPGNTAINVFYVYGMNPDLFTARGEAGGGIPGTWVVLDSRAASLRDAAHEIGHSLGLYHPFDPVPNNVNVGFLEIVPDVVDERLMGYGSGSRLIRPEWDKINDLP